MDIDYICNNLDSEILGKCSKIIWNVPLNGKPAL